MSTERTPNEADDLLNDLLSPAGTTGASGSDKSVPGSAQNAATMDSTPADSAGVVSVQIDGTSIDVSTMAVYDWSAPPHPPLDIAIQLGRSQAAGEWSARIEWPASREPGRVVYRVVFADGEPPDSDCDDVEGTLSVSAEAHVVDDTMINLPLASVRFYEVWAYCGTTVEQAVGHAPYLHATGRVVWPPLRISAVPDNGQIVGRWQHLPGARYRWMRQAPKEARNERPSPAAGTEVLEHGFVDRGAAPGVPYVYSVFAGVQVDGGMEWSDAAARVKTELPVRLVPVTDLQVQLDPTDPGVAHVAWSTPPAGVVDIYRSSEPPSADIHDAGEVELALLPAQEYGLAKGDLVNNPIAFAPDGGRALMRNVSLPADGAEFYITPVTRSMRGRVGVPGRSVTILRPMPPGQPYLEDRVDWILVVFEWPSGASKVNLYVTGIGGTIDPRTATPLASIIEFEARSFGGFQIPRDQLAVGPCALHLSGYKQHAGQEAHSAVVTLEHAFPVLVRYSLTRQTGILRGSKLLLNIASREGARSVGLALVWTPEGLPLTLDDGQVLARWVQDIPDARDPAPPIDLKSLLADRQVPTHGYIRLMADPAAPVAVLDPPASMLRLATEGS